MDKKSIRTTIIASGLAGLAAFGGLTLAANAETKAPAPGITASQTQGTANDKETTDDQSGAQVTGTVKAPQSQTELSGQAEHDALAGLAKVSQSDAEKAALTAVPGGTVSSAQLEEVDGYVVWQVHVKDAGGAVTQVTIDAGDAKVLAQESDNDGERDDASESKSGSESASETGETPEASPTR